MDITDLYLFIYVVTSFEKHHPVPVLPAPRPRVDLLLMCTVSICCRVGVFYHSVITVSYGFLVFGL